ncbi:MAG: hypothetical protein R3D88_01450 [Alphaproteobacteria bacterium]|nr:hypothetical protein [Alphaproteobacteria bacterium]
MIEIIGHRKIYFIGFLALVAVGLYYYGFMHLKPQVVKVERSLKVSKSEFSQIKANMDNLVIGLQQFDTQKEEFNKLRAYGFFDAQDRLDLMLRFREMQKESGLLLAKFDISPAKVEDNPLAKDAGFQVLTTNIKFNLEAIEDVDVYKFLYLFNYGFPAQVFITDIKMSRDIGITRTLIQRLGSGSPVAIVKAEVMVTIKTMIEDPLQKKTDEEMVN